MVFSDSTYIESVSASVRKKYKAEGFNISLLPVFVRKYQILSPDKKPLHEWTFPSLEDLSSASQDEFSPNTERFSWKTTCKNISDFYTTRSISLQLSTRYEGFNGYRYSVGFSDFLNSRGFQELKRKESQSGQLTYHQKSTAKSKSGGIFGVIFGSSNKASGDNKTGEVDTRKRIANANYISELSISAASQIYMNAVERGLSDPSVEKKLQEQFFDILLSKADGPHLMKLKVTNEKLSGSLFNRPVDLGNFKEIVDSVGSFKAKSEDSFSIANCQEFIEKAIGMPPTKKSESNNAPLAKKGTKEFKDNKTRVVGNPNAGECKMQSSASAGGNLTVRFDGEKKRWIPTDMEVYVLDTKEIESSFKAEINKKIFAVGNNVKISTLSPNNKNLYTDETTNLRERLKVLEGKPNNTKKQCGWIQVKTHDSLTCPGRQFLAGLCLSNTKEGCNLGAGNAWFTTGAMYCCNLD